MHFSIEVKKALSFILIMPVLIPQTNAELQDRWPASPGFWTRRLSKVLSLYNLVVVVR